MTPTPAASSHDTTLDDFHAVVLETEELLKAVASLGDEHAGVLLGSLAQALAAAAARLADIRERSIARAAQPAKSPAA